MNTLSRIFGSELRLRLMRFFLLNQGATFDLEAIQQKSNARPQALKLELAFLVSAGMIKMGKVAKKVSVKKGKKFVLKKIKAPVWSLSEKFKFKDAFTDFLVKTHPVEHKDIVKKLERAGRIKAILISGIFTGDTESRLDLFVVGDNIKSSSMDRIVRNIEADMGKDIRYTVLSGPDFAYRVSMNDKLVRDVLDCPHTTVLDKIGIAK